jgi:hypothetical protein
VFVEESPELQAVIINDIIAIEKIIDKSFFISKYTLQVIER